MKCSRGFFDSYVMMHSTSTGILSANPYVYVVFPRFLILLEHNIFSPFEFRFTVRNTSACFCRKRTVTVFELHIYNPLVWFRRVERKPGERERSERAIASQRQRRRFVPHRLRADRPGSAQFELHLRRRQGARQPDQDQRPVTGGPDQSQSWRSRIA